MYETYRATLNRLIERLEKETDLNVNRGFDYVFAISVSDAKFLIELLKAAEKS